jgi:hypothetical protein
MTIPRIAVATSEVTDMLHTVTLSHYVIKAMVKARRKNNVHEIPSR